MWNNINTENGAEYFQKAKNPLNSIIKDKEVNDFLSRYKTNRHQKNLLNNLRLATELNNYMQYLGLKSFTKFVEKLKLNKNYKILSFNNNILKLIPSEQKNNLTHCFYFDNSLKRIKIYDFKQKVLY